MQNLLRFTFKLSFQSRKHSYDKAFILNRSWFTNHALFTKSHLKEHLRFSASVTP